MLGQMLVELQKADEWYGEDYGITGFPPYPYRTCEGGCGCRYGTMDADARECACGGPCCEGNPIKWFGKPHQEMAQFVLLSMMRLIHHTGDPSAAGRMLLGETQALMRRMVEAKVTAHREEAAKGAYDSAPGH